MYQDLLTFSNELCEAIVAEALLSKPEDVERSSENSVARGSS